jgi:hypothetical protein
MAQALTIRGALLFRKCTEKCDGFVSLSLKGAANYLVSIFCMYGG